MFIYVFVPLYVLICLLLLVVVLLQQGKGGDIAAAFGGSSSQTAFGARAGATVLTRATAILGALFMLVALSLAIVNKSGSGGSVVSGVAAPAAPAKAPAAVPALPSSGAPVTAPATPPATTPPATTTPGKTPRSRAAGRRQVGSGTGAWKRPNLAESRPGLESSRELELRSSKFEVSVKTPRGSGGIGRRTSLRGWR